MIGVVACTLSLMLCRVVVPLCCDSVQPAKGVTAAMYGNNKMLPAHEMEHALSKYLDLLFKVVPAAK